MSKDNVTPFKKFLTSQETESITLQQIKESMQQWRLQKKNRSEKIPDDIWDMIFTLIKTTPESHVLTALSIGKAQFESKALERRISHRITEEPPPPKNQAAENDIEFCEADSEYPLAYKPAKTFNTTTSVVELYRPDGMLMKIHICTDRFEELLRAFFKG
jgi:hypothetical protein